MPRFDGDVFLFGTAMILSIVPPFGGAGTRPRDRHDDGSIS
jgi:hypothetical protein